MGDVSDLEANCHDVVTNKIFICCSGLWGLILFIFMCIMLGSFHHLGPDDQVLIKTARGHRVVDGPTSGQFNPFQEKEWRKATMLDPLEYAIVQNRMDATLRAVEGPHLLFLSAYDDLKEVLTKVVLEKDEWVRLIDKRTGTERVERGPGTITPSPTETIPFGVQKAVMLNMDSSVVIRNKTNGLLTLVTQCTYSDTYAPAPMEEIVEIRRLIHVLPHEALIVRDVNGVMKVYSSGTSNEQGDEDEAAQGCFAQNTQGSGTAFFLPPYSKIVRMSWSSYAAPGGQAQPTRMLHASWPAGENPHAAPQDALGRRLQTIPVADEESLYVDQMQATTHSGPKLKVAAIDLRTHKSFYKYSVRTSDNVKMELEGTIFWLVNHVETMIKMTSDPAGDVWAKARATLIQAVGQVTLATFMRDFHTVVGDAFASSMNDTFYSDRGIELVNMELTKYAPVDAYTKDILQNIIRGTVQRINDLQTQRSQNDVAKEKLAMDIRLEGNRTQLIDAQAENSRLLSQTAGITAGTRLASEIGSFVDGLEASIDNTNTVLEMFKTQKILGATNLDTQTLSNGASSLYVAPQDMELRLQMPHV